MRNVAIVGAGMTRFGKYADRGLKELSREAVTLALDAAGIDKHDLQVAIVGNAAAGVITGQECIRAQVVLREMGIDEIPMVNTENACASSSTALQLAWLYVASGMYDVALALGVEKMFSEDKSRTLAAFSAGVDVEQLRGLMEQLKPPSEQKAGAESGAGKSRSLFMDIYAAGARAHMAKYGTTKEQFARIAVKNHNNGSLNPHAQYRERYTLEDPRIADGGGAADAPDVRTDRRQRRGGDPDERGEGAPVHDQTGVGARHGPDVRFGPAGGTRRHHGAGGPARVRDGRHDAARHQRHGGARRVGAGGAHAVRGVGAVRRGRGRAAYRRRCDGRSAGGCRSTQAAACWRRGIPSARRACRRSTRSGSNYGARPAIGRWPARARG